MKEPKLRTLTPFPRWFLIALFALALVLVAFSLVFVGDTWLKVAFTIIGAIACVVTGTDIFRRSRG